MNATCQRTVNCMSGCVVSADSHEVGLSTRESLPLPVMKPTKAFPRNYFKLSKVMVNRRKEECEKESNGWRRWTESERLEKVSVCDYSRCVLLKMGTMVSPSFHSCQLNE